MNPLTKIYTTSKEKFEEFYEEEIEEEHTRCESDCEHQRREIEKRLRFKSHNKQLVLEMLEGVEREMYQIILVDTVIKFNSTPKIGETFDIEKHNHANRILNDMNKYTHDAILSFFHSAKEEILADK